MTTEDIPMQKLHNEIIHGDCLEIMSTIEDNSIDMILADLPYGTTRNKWDSVIPLDELWEQYERLIKDNGVIVLTAQTPFDKVLGASNLKMLKYEWIWEKSSATGHLNAKKMPMKAHENILVFYKKLPTYNPIKTQGHERKVSKAEHKVNSKMSTNYNPTGLTTYDSTERYPRSVLKFSTDKKKRPLRPTQKSFTLMDPRSVLKFPTDKQKQSLHPTQKPVALMEYLIKTYTNPGDLVLDNVVGSGTTAIAAMNTGRNFIAIEKDKDYYEIAKDRIVKNIPMFT